MPCPNVWTPIFFVFVALQMGCHCSDQQIAEIKKLLNLCQFIDEHLAMDGVTKNRAIIECGKEIEDARKQLQERGAVVGTSGGARLSYRARSISLSPKRIYQNFLEKKKETELKKYRDKLSFCVDKLVDKSNKHPEYWLEIVVENWELEKFHMLLQNGRPFIKRITYYANYPMKKKFFINLIETMLSPFTSANTIVEDIGIATTILGAWDRDILQETLNEKFIEEITFNMYNNEPPLWEVLYKIDANMKAQLHFCQWRAEEGRGQRFRMWRYEKEQMLLQRLLSNNESTTPNDVCF